MPTAWYRTIPDDQKISYVVTPREGAMMRAGLLGGQLRAIGRLMAAFGDEDGLKYETFVADISMGDDGSIKFDLVVLPKLEDDDEEEDPA